MAKRLLALVEFMGHARLPALYRALGFEVIVEFSARKAVSQVRRWQPQVIAADFYFQADFRDRLSNLESVLAAAQPLAETRILVFFEPASREALARVSARMRIDAAMPTPVDDAGLRALLTGWA